MRAKPKFAVALLLAALLSGCGKNTAPPPSDEEQKKILLVLKTIDNPFFAELQRGSLAAANGKATIIVRAGQNESDVSGQRRILEQAFVQEVSSNKRMLAGVLITPSGSSDQLVKALKSFRDKNVPVVLLDTAIDEAALARGKTSINLYIGSNNWQGGELAAQLLSDHFKKQGKRPKEILLLNGALESETAQQRRAGFLAKMTGVKVTERNARWRRSEAQTTLNTLLAAGKSYDAVFAANDEMALGVVNAYRAHPDRQRPVIIGFDAIDEAVNAVKSGDLLATIAQDPAAMGVKGVEAVLTNGFSQKINEIPVKAIERPSSR